jgi:hypothetical protein
MVETAQAVSGSGRLTAIRQFVQQGCLIVNGPLAGYLASIAFGWTAAACGGIMFLMVPVTALFLREQRQPPDRRLLLGNARAQLTNIATARTMWAAAGLMALFYIAPGFGTAIFYKQQNELHMDTQTQGFLQLIGGVFGVLAAVGYGILCRRLNLRTLLAGCMILGTVANLAYLLYSSLGRAQVIEGFNGFGYTLAELALMDLAVRATPAGSEGLGFSLMVSVRNLALFGTDWFGSKLLDAYHFSFDSLVIANSVTTAIAVPLVFLLPGIIVGRKDAERFDEGPLPRQQWSDREPGQWAGRSESSGLARTPLPRHPCHDRGAGPILCQLATRNRSCLSKPSSPRPAASSATASPPTRGCAISTRTEKTRSRRYCPMPSRLSKALTRPAG